MTTKLSCLNTNKKLTEYIKYNSSETTFKGIEFDNIIKINDGTKLSNKNNIITVPRSDHFKFCECVFDFNPNMLCSKTKIISFQKCIFKETIGTGVNSLLRIQNKEILFNNCEITKLNIGDISDIKYNSLVSTLNFALNGGEIKEFIIENIKLQNKFYINRQKNNKEQIKIGEISIKNVIFLQNFKLHNAKIDKISLEDIDFEKQADFFLSTFNKPVKNNKNNNLSFNAINIKGLAIFEQCEFFNKVLFNYVTFENFGNFRNAIFHKGLNLDCTNIQKNINFVGITKLDSHESKETTSIETYRIIKHNLIQLNNRIEANKYQSLELNKQRKEIWNNKKVTFELLSDGIVSLLHYLASAHSKYWPIPLFWIIIMGLITSYYFNNITIDNIIKYSYIGNFDDSFKENIKIFVLNKIVLGYLYYQFLTTVRRNTKNI